MKPSETIKIKPINPYHVELFEKGCEHCTHADLYAILDIDNEECTGVFYGSKEEAEEVADEMNRAFEAGRQYSASSVLDREGELVEAAQAFMKEAVVLSEDYLSAFVDLPNDATIQGWDKARWIRALKTYNTLKAALASNQQVILVGCNSSAMLTSSDKAD